MGFIKAYTREPVENKYPNSLANSVHFAYSADGVAYEVLNQNYGMLFAKAVILDDNTLAERGIRNPKIYRQGNEYIIAAEPVDSAGNRAEEGKILYWKTEDFLTFSEENLIPEEEFSKTFKALETPGDVIEIPEELMSHIRERWMPLCSIRAEYPQEIEIQDWSELEDFRAKVVYSDGSSDDKKIVWDTENKVFLGDRRYRLTGSTKPVKTGFPLAVGYADPVIFAWNDYWYFLATNDNVDDIGLFIRKADSVEGLFADDVQEYCILEYDEAKGFCQTFWAPEAHVIGKELYILFAVSGKQWGPQCHMMRLKKDGKPENAEDWEEPVRVRKADGSALEEDGITLDMTYFKVREKSYVCWSLRFNIGTPKDSGSMLCIATVDEDKPWILTSEPVLISRPLYGWENNSGTINNEGPYPLILENKIYLAYSGGDACGYYYVVGYLMASAGDDLLDAKSWHKEPAPVLHSLSVEGIQGPGHNSFFRDADGRLMIAYHAQEREKFFKRCSAFHRVHISRSGFPLLNVTGERDVAKELERVEIEVCMVGK